MSVTNVYCKLVGRPIPAPQPVLMPHEQGKPPAWIPGHAIEINGYWYWSTRGQIHSWSRSDSEEAAVRVVSEHIGILHRMGVFEVHAIESHLDSIEL